LCMSNNKKNGKMDTSRFTKGQKEALLQSLSNQKSPMTRGEKALFEQLRKEAIVIVKTQSGCEFEMFENKVRQIGMDTFGEDYRNRWIKLKESSNGVYFTASYFGNKRIYLANIYSL
jgi:hypothetical protein